MKRLIQSKLFKMLNITTVINKYVEPGYYECFINPERNEFETIIKSDSYHSFKAIIMSNGDIYVFNSSFSMHGDAAELFKIPTTQDSLNIDYINSTVALCNMNEEKYIVESIKLLKNCSAIWNIISEDTLLAPAETLGYELLRECKTVNDFLNLKFKG